MVRWHDGAVSEYPWLWLRDHDSATLHPVTQQRQLHTASVDAGIRATSATIDDGAVEIAWNDGGPVSALSHEFLAQFRDRRGHASTWWPSGCSGTASTIIDEWPTVEHSAVIGREDRRRRVDEQGRHATVSAS